MRTLKGHPHGAQQDRELESVGNDMAHVLVFIFHEESVFFNKKSLQPFSKPPEDTEKHIRMLHSKREMEMFLTVFTMDSLE